MTEAGLFTVTQDTREVAGLLVPYGVLSKPNLTGNQPLRFRRVILPRDPAIVGLNLEHDRFEPIGRAVQLREDTAVGVYAVFRIADTDEGDAWLADHTGTTQLSPEVKSITREAGDWATAQLTGAGSVAEGAFAGAGLFSVAVDDADPDAAGSAGTAAGDAAGPPRTTAGPYGDDAATDPAVGRGIVPPYLDPRAAAGAGNDDDAGSRDQDDEDDDAEQDDAEQDDAAPAAPTTTPAAPDERQDDMGDAQAPAGTYSRQRSNSTPALSKAGFYAAVNHARRTGDRSAIQPYLQSVNEAGLFALSDIKYDGTGGLVTAAGTPGDWLGQLWTGRTFARRIIPLMTPKPLTSMSMIGWVWGVRPTMAPWAGNKAPVPSNAPTVLPKSFGAVRYSGGHDLAREYYDFNVTDVIDSYGDAMVDSYAMLSDAYALTQLVAGATPYTADPANTVNTALLDIVDGALAVIAGGGTPSWALVDVAQYKSILATPKEDALDYLSAQLSLEEGSASVSGEASRFRIQPDARLAAGSTIVGDKLGATAWELPGVPIRVEAPNLTLGGIDNAFFGYIGAGVTTPAVVVKKATTALLEGVEEEVILAAEKSRSSKS